MVDFAPSPHIFLAKLHLCLHGTPVVDGMYMSDPRVLVIDIQAFVTPWHHCLYSSLEEICVKCW
jgi:hypothetical protein